MVVESDKASPCEMIVQNDTKAKEDHYDFPIVPARPMIPPRAPARGGTLMASKRLLKSQPLTDLY